MFLRLSVAAFLIATPALAAEPPEAPVATAGAAPGVAEQIDAYLKSSPVLQIDDPDAVEGVVPPGPDRRPHGEVGVAIGTGGYRSVYLRSEAPVGDLGRVSLAFQDTRHGRADGRLYGGSPAFGLDRQRCDLQAMTPTRSLDARFGGPHGQCVRPIPSW